MNFKIKIDMSYKNMCKKIAIFIIAVILYTLRNNPSLIGHISLIIMGLMTFEMILNFLKLTFLNILLFKSKTSENITIKKESEENNVSNL